MYKVEKKGYGYLLTFGDEITMAEMSNWVKLSEQALASAPAKFGVFVDMRTLKPLAPDAQAEMQRGQKLFKMKGMERSVVIVNSSVIAMQFKRIARETGIYDWERYISAADEANWEKKGVDWLEKAIDPDK